MIKFFKYLPIKLPPTIELFLLILELGFSFNKCKGQLSYDHDANISSSDIANTNWVFCQRY
uniref:Uncharacterized protein n=1 Tax=Nelumbo nucifera TaxID=4432 RepID=A0A822XV11_NELNU|nr:TPA_asm: hypothetical protein HUJ06_022751 [Nelumbo nucifera]